MSEEDPLFYQDYNPPTHISNRLNSPEEDIKLKVPYRDVLGVLELHQIWHSEDALPADEIKNRMVEWAQKERPRAKSEPTERTVRNQLRKLENKGLVQVNSNNSKKLYWKIPDSEIGSPIWNKIVHHGKIGATLIEHLLTRNRFVLFGTAIYLSGSFILFIYGIIYLAAISSSLFAQIIALRIMFTGLLIFIGGHVGPIFYERLK